MTEEEVRASVKEFAQRFRASGIEFDSGTEGIENGIVEHLVEFGPRLPDETRLLLALVLVTLESQRQPRPIGDLH